MLGERLRAALGDGGTCENIPRHIWKHEINVVVSKELRPGETTETPEIQARLNRAYNNGESMWMAAYDMVTVARETAKARGSLEESNKRVLRHATIGSK